MNLKGPIVPQSNIIPEFNPQTVGSKRVQINLPRKKIGLPPDFFSRNASACEALREIIFGSKRRKKRRELNHPSFYRPLIC